MSEYRRWVSGWVRDMYPAMWARAGVRTMSMLSPLSLSLSVSLSFFLQLGPRTVGPRTVGPLDSWAPGPNCHSTDICSPNVGIIYPIQIYISVFDLRNTCQLNLYTGIGYILPTIGGYMPFEGFPPLVLTVWGPTVLLQKVDSWAPDSWALGQKPSN